MSNPVLESVAKRYAPGMPALEQELLSKLGKSAATIAAAEADESPGRRAAVTPFGIEIGRMTTTGEPEFANERIVKRAVLEAGGRPVARITDNKATTEFIGPKSKFWADAINGSLEALNRAVPAVGRIELTNSEIAWAGTGWLIAEGIVVTNRHVAAEFTRRGQTPGEFLFRTGNFRKPMACDIDFLEEENRMDSLEHPITSILWVAPEGEADVAFLRVTPAPGKSPLPTPIRLADEVVADTQIAAIGYPAKDDSIPDQALVRQLFGDVYEKKRLAPGRVMSVEGTVLKHDCSTLGGNSGSVLLSLETGEAVGLHRGGLLDDSANLAVPASHLRTLLDRVQRREGPGAAPPRSIPPDVGPGGPVQAGGIEAAGAGGRGSVGIVLPAGAQGTFAMKWNVPVEVTVRIGGPAVAGDAAVMPGAPLPSGQAFEQAIQLAHRMFDGHPDVLEIRPGYRFKSGWITDDRVIVLKVREKRPGAALAVEGRAPLPREIGGIGVDVRTAPLVDQLEDLGVDLTILERPSRPAGYVEPVGYDDPDSDMALKRFTGPMRAVFHVSPHAGFPFLKKFLGRVKDTLTATIYEWEPNHISDAIESAIRPDGNTLRMVTQRNGVGGSDATLSAVGDMIERIGDDDGKFEHVWASVRGPSRLIQSSYHIKVASRDGEEFWLSSGNWKDSNQPLIAQVPDEPGNDHWLREHNREWHALVQHKELAELLQRYIEYDFEQAQRFPLPVDEGVAVPDIEFFVPLDVEEPVRERRRRGTYSAFLAIKETDEPLDIQPLLTPDRDANGDRLFLKTVTAMLRRATGKIYVQNQSFGFSGDDNEELTTFFTVLRDRQREGLDVRIIFRDAREFGRVADRIKQEELLERMKDFGFDTSPERLRLQRRCHTKGIVIDAKEILLGSQNLTNQGALFNRDASLLVRSPRVAKFFEDVFLFDWDVLAHNRADEHVGGIRRAGPGEETPRGFRRVSLAEMLRDD